MSKSFHWFFLWEDLKLLLYSSNPLWKLTWNLNCHWSFGPALDISLNNYTFWSILFTNVFIYTPAVYFFYSKIFHLAICQRKGQSVVNVTHFIRENTPNHPYIWFSYSAQQSCFFFHCHFLQWISAFLDSGCTG